MFEGVRNSLPPSRSASSRGARRQTHVGAWRGSAVEGVIKGLPRPVEETATGAVIRNRAVLHVSKTAVTRSAATVQYTRIVRRHFDAWPDADKEGGIGSIAVMRHPPDPFSERNSRCSRPWPIRR